MYSLPSLAPQDSYSLWYTSSTTPQPTAFITPPLHAPSNSSSTNDPPTRNITTAPHRTPLARLRHDEDYLALRKQNIRDYGSGWIKPPGVPKSLFQLREEKRELEEHQEAMRREALAQELAEAEADAEGLFRGEGEAEGAEMDGMERDLDDEVPDGDATAGLLDSSDEDSEGEGREAHEDEGAHTEDFPANVLASRLSDDVYREALIRGDEVRRSQFSGEGSVEDEEEDAGGLLQEEDLVREQRQLQPQADQEDTEMDVDMDMDMDADLDAEIPEAGYEHTDTEEELSSSEEEDDDDDDDDDEDDESQLSPQRAAASMVRSDGTQNSTELSNLTSPPGWGDARRINGRPSQGR